jgi:hypothetical protein
VLVLLQPFIGLVHHRLYISAEAEGKPKGFLLGIHKWYGRMIILLGIINGGLGLQLAANTRAGEIVYGVIGGLVGVAICALVVSVEKNGRKKRVAGQAEAGDVAIGEEK